MECAITQSNGDYQGVCQRVKHNSCLTTYKNKNKNIKILKIKIKNIKFTN